MTIPLLDMEGTGHEIAERLSDYADRRIHVIVLPAELETQNRDERSMTEVLAEIAANISSEELARLPGDFTDQLDHYLYGSPKQ